MDIFEKASSGLSGMDRILDFLRLGDNVVWQVDSVADYTDFVQVFLGQALQEKRKIVYMRFGQHEEIVAAQPGISIYHLDPDQGFEAFSSEVHRISSAEGEGVFYIFDCLSDLLSAWATDLMIGNFFKVTCPYLFELNTIAYFSLLRNRNSFETIARIRETTQLFLDVYRCEEKVFVHPLKVWNRYSPSMFLPHIRMEDKFIPITSSIEASRIFAAFKGYVPGSVERKLDYGDRLFLKAQELLEDEEDDKSVEKAQMLDQLSKMIIGRDERILELTRKYFSLNDLLEVKGRLIGSGFIGGKSVGMLLARKILKASDAQWEERLETHDSFYIGSDLYYTYLVENDCWNLRLEQKQEASYFTVAAELRQKILNGVFPEFIRDQFFLMLEYFGQSPVIIRSSSLLEDGFGNAFAGKYESIFCVNQGDPQERYRIFEEAVRKVYASTMSEDALVYRQQRGLAGSDEQMALLVQRVSGSHHAQYFFPDMAGVAMSRNLYVWKEDMDPHAGMIRLVMGLGTRAVDRVDDDYPRVVALDQPMLRPDLTQEGIRRFSQHKVDLLDTILNDCDTIPVNQLATLKTELDSWKLMAVRDHETSRRMRELGLGSEAWIVNFDDLLENTAIVEVMREMLQTLEEAYQYPVDTEFTINYNAFDNMKINLLQCRPLQTIKKESIHRNTMVLPEHILFTSRKNFMGYGIPEAIRRIIYINNNYIALTKQDKYQIARVVGILNHLLKDNEAGGFILMGPGRWGSSLTSLGIPVSFSEICNTGALIEIAVKEKGYIPELSYGTHFFQDLVETRIVYLALFPDEKEVTFNQEILERARNSLGDLLPEYEKFQNVLKVIDLAETDQALYIDLDLQLQQLRAYLGELTV